jgi:WD40 repeat protein
MPDKEIIGGHAESILSLTATENNRLISASADKTLKVWDLEEQRRRYQLHLDSGDPNKMSFAKHQIRKDVEERLKNLNKVMEITSADKERKEELKNKKTNGSIIKRDLESPDANS